MNDATPPLSDQASDRPLVIGTGPARPLAAGLGADWWELPEVAFDPTWSTGPRVEEWRTTTAAGPSRSAVVVAVWTEDPRPSALVDTGLDSWLDTVEAPFALWFAALTAGAQRCADGGQVVGVVDRPSPKESAGWSSVSAVADAVEVMVHSLAEIHRPRGVRVNLIATPDRLETGRSSRSPSVVGTVSMLLGARPDGITSVVVPMGAGH